MRPLPVLCSLLALAVPAAARAQLGLDLSNDKPSLGLDLSEDDYTQGPPVVAVPPLRGDGRPDLETYRPLWAALKEKLGHRLVDDDATLKAIEAQKLRGPALASLDGRTRLLKALGAERLIVFTAVPKAKKIDGQVYAKADATPVEQALPWTRKLDVARARPLVAGLLKAARNVLVPPPAPPPAPVVEAPADPVVQAGVGDVGDEANRESGVRKRAPSEPLKPAFAVVAVGAGASLRSFSTRTVVPLAPTSPDAMAGLGVAAALYPLRLVSSLRESWLSDLSLEGHYRRNLAQALVQGGARDGATCSVDDDEIVLRAGWRYALGANLPRVGLGFGWASERTLFDCDGPALSTRHLSTELHLRVAQPILGETLGVEVSGGPRFLLSKRAANHMSRAWSVEGWLTARPAEYFFLRAGGRFTSTEFTTAPEGIALRDQRTFVGLELGAAM